MIRFLLVPVLLLIATTCSASQQSNQALYHTLDSLIANYNQLTAEKERRVTNIKDGVRGIKLSPEQ